MKEGEAGQKKVNQYTRYFTVVLAFIEAIGFVFLFKSYGAFPPTRRSRRSRFFLIVLTLTVGTALVMWLGELITQRGIGNGISLMIFASIVSRLPSGLQKLFTLNPGYWVLMGVISVAGGGRSSSTSPRASAASRCSTPSGWSAARSTAGRAPTCRCASTWPGSSRSSSPRRCCCSRSPWRR